jgi:acyl carrier protein
MSTLQRLQDLLISGYNLSREQLPPEAPLNSLGIDSLGLIELMFLIEDHFGISLPDDRTTDFVTIGDAVSYVDNLLLTKSPTHPADKLPAVG